MEIDFNSLISTTKDVAKKAESLGEHLTSISNVADRSKEILLVFDGIAKNQSDLDAKQIQLDANLRAIQLSLANQEPKLLRITDLAESTKNKTEESELMINGLQKCMSDSDLKTNRMLEEMSKQKLMLENAILDLEKIKVITLESQKVVKNTFIASAFLILMVIAVFVYFYVNLQP